MHILIYILPIGTMVLIICVAQYKKPTNIGLNDCLDVLAFDEWFTYEQIKEKLKLNHGTLNESKVLLCLEELLADGLIERHLRPAHPTITQPREELYRKINISSRSYKEDELPRLTEHQ